MARNHNHQGDCDCSTVVSRENIHEHLAFCVVVNGDYAADPDDEVIHVTAGRRDAAGVLIVPAVTLPCPSEVDHECAHVTVVANGGDVRIDGLNDQAAVNIDGVPSTGARILAGGSAVTFWLTEDHDSHGSDCGCSSAYWIAECCGLTPAPAAAAAG